MRRLLAAAVLAAATLSAPVVTAAPAAAALPCEWGPFDTNPWNYPLDDIACVVLDTSAGIRLVAVTDVQPNWTYQVKSWGGGTKGVEIRFTNVVTDQRTDFRYAPGRTKIG